MYVPEDYSNYKYVVQCSDNYVVLTNRKTVNADWTNPVDIDIIYQYFKPSFITIEGVRTITSQQVFEQIDVDDNMTSRADFCDIWLSCLLFISVIVFTCINCVTKLVHRGGALYGN